MLQKLAGQLNQSGQRSRQAQEQHGAEILPQLIPLHLHGVVKHLQLAQEGCRRGEVMVAVRLGAVEKRQPGRVEEGVHPHAEEVEMAEPRHGVTVRAHLRGVMEAIILRGEDRTV